MFERSLQGFRTRSTRLLLPPVWLCPVLGRQIASTAQLNAPKRRRAPKSKAKFRGEIRKYDVRKFRDPRAQSHFSQLVEAVEQGKIIELPEKETFDTALESKDLGATLNALQALLKIDPQAVKETYAYAQLLHFHIRSAKFGRRLKKSEREQRDELFTKHLNALRKLYVARELPADPTITRSILAAFRDFDKPDDAVAFWEWARVQQSAARPAELSSHALQNLPDSEFKPDYTDLRVYGVALPILASAGRTLEDTEQTYQEGVRRYSYGFNEYHLSPAAWLQNPERPTSIPGTSASLLGGLMASRFIHGEVAAAYLCVDTLLRLHPTQIPVTVQAELSPERPLTEQVQTQCMFLRAGNASGSAYLASLLSDLSRRARSEEDIEIKLRIHEMMLTLVRMSYASGTPLDVAQLNILILSFTSVLPETIDPSVYSAAVNMCVDLMYFFKGRGVDIDETLLRQMKYPENATAAPVLNPVTISCEPIPDQIDQPTLDDFLSSYAALGLRQSVQSFWATYRLRQHAESEKPALPWQRLSESLAQSAIVCTQRPDTAAGATEKIRAQHRKTLEKEMEEAGISTESNPGFVKAVLNRFDEMVDAKPTPTEDGTQNGTEDATQFIKYFESIRNMIASFRNDIGTHNGSNTRNWPISRVSILPNPEIPEDWQAELYDELVLGQQQAVAEPAEPSEVEQQDNELTETSSQSDSPEASVEARLLPHEELLYESRTGIPLAELRYRNWCDMNFLLLEAQAFEDILGEDIDRALETGTGKGVPRVRNFGHVTDRTKRAEANEKQWQMHLKVRARIAPVLQDKVRWRERIIELRKGLTPPSDIGEVSI